MTIIDKSIHQSIRQCANSFFASLCSGRAKALCMWTAKTLMGRSITINRHWSPGIPLHQHTKGGRGQLRTDKIARRENLWLGKNSMYILIARYQPGIDFRIKDNLPLLAQARKERIGVFQIIENLECPACLISSLAHHVFPFVSPHCRGKGSILSNFELSMRAI